MTNPGIKKSKMKMGAKFFVLFMGMCAVMLAEPKWAVAAWAKPVISLEDCLAIAEANHH